MKILGWWTIAGMAVAWGGLTASISAQELNPSLHERISIRVGPLWADADATIKSFDQQTKVDQGIGASEMDVSIYGLWRITPKWRVEAGYSGIESEGSDSIQAEIDLGLFSVPADLTIGGTFDTSVARLAMGYAFRHEENWELGLDLGINFTSVKQSIHVSGSVVGDADLPSIDVSEPLPTLGVFFNYALSSKWYWTSRGGAFAFDIGDIDGTIYELFGGVEFRPWEHAGLGLS